MHSSQNCLPTNAPKCSRKWNYRKNGMSKHKKAKKERLCVNKDLHAIKSEAIELSSNVCEAHLEALKQTNINHPTKRNGSAKTLRERHPKRINKRLPVGHSGWKTIHGAVTQRLWELCAEQPHPHSWPWRIGDIFCFWPSQTVHGVTTPEKPQIILGATCG